MNKEHITKQDVREVLKAYWAEYKKYPWLTAGSFLLPGLGSIFIFLVPPLIISRIVNIIGAHGDTSFHALGGLVALFGLLWFLGEVIWRFGMYFLTRLEAKAIHNLSCIGFQKLIDRDYDFFSNNFVGTLTKKTQSFARSFEGFTDTFSFNVTPNILPMIFAMVILARYSIWISLVLVITLGIVVLLVVPRIRARARLVAERHDASSKLNGRLSDTITNILAVKSFAKENQEYQRFSEYSFDFQQKFKKAADYHTLRIDTLLSPMYVLTNILGLVAAIFFTQKYNLAAGAMVVIFSYYSTVTRSFWQVNNVYRTIESTIGEAAEFTNLVSASSKIEDKPGAQMLKTDNGEVRFDDVTFSYHEAENEGTPFLKNFSLVIPPNQKVGLVGPSGGGKTTITKLIMRFIDVDSGSVRIDDTNISTVTQASLRSAIAYVPQEPLLFHRSLAENIGYGNEHAAHEDVVRASKLAHADEFITKLPLGYDTLVGERGIKLSGGQRQRIAIARALLKESKILVLDEATSALDSESEKYIQESLLDLMKDKTALVIAHRLSTIKHLDRILVLDDGTIVQDGTHDELVAQKDGLYATLWSHQSGGFIED